jgi:hypothetical protein
MSGSQDLALCSEHTRHGRAAVTRAGRLVLADGAVYSQAGPV